MMDDRYEDYSDLMNHSDNPSSNYISSSHPSNSMLSSAYSSNSASDSESSSAYPSNSASDSISSSAHSSDSVRSDMEHGKYLTYDINYAGRLNNQRFCLRNMLFLSYLLNRTLVIPRWEEHLSWHDRNYKNIPWVRVSAHKYIDIDILSRIHPTLAGDEATTMALLTGLEKFDGTSIANKYLTLKANGRNPSSAFRAIRVFGNVNQAVLHIDNPFQVRIDPGREIITKLMSMVMFANWTRNTATEFLARLPHPVLALHIRHFEGSCPGWVRSTKSPPSQCEQNISELISTIRSTQFDFRTLVLLSDHQRPEVDSALRIAFSGNVSEFHRPDDLTPTQEMEFGAIDSEIAVQADFFVGSWMSTLSRLTHIHRDAIGLPWATLGGKAIYEFW